MRDLRGREISMIFQNPRAALNPIRKVGRQIEDVLLRARQGGAVGGHRKGDRDARPGPDRAAARALSRLSVRAVRRHVPARRHRARARLPAAAPDRRRADHRPRRHHAEDGDGPDRRADPRARHVDDPDHPRSRPRRHLLRPGRGDGEGPRGRDRDLAGDLHRAVAPLHAQADARDAAARRVAARSAAGGRDAPGRRSRRQAQRRRPQAAARGRQARQGISAQGARRLRRRAQEAVPPRAGARARHVPRGRRHQLHASAAARASAWSASPAAASPPPPPWSCG